MKLLFACIVGWVAWLPMSTYAQYQTHPVQEVAQHHANAQTISICASNSPLNVTGATSSGTLTGSFAVEVYNLAASTVTLNCGFDPTVSTASASGLYGREVAAGVGQLFQIRLPQILVYCGTQNSAGCTRATITQLGK